MISRVWHGWTTLEQADAYEALLTDEIFPGIQQRQIAGYHGIQLFRRTTGLEMERLLAERNQVIKAVAESSQWQTFLPVLCS